MQLNDYFNQFQQNSSKSDGANQQFMKNSNYSTNRLKINFDIIFNEWYDKPTLKTLLMTAIDKNNYQIVDTLSKNKVCLLR